MDETIPGPGFVSPPTTSVLQNSQHWSIPLAMSRRSDSSISPGILMAVRSPTGRAPIAARSLKFTAAAVHPNCSQLILGVLCLSTDTASVVATTLPSESPPITAASSPGPMTVSSDLLRKIERICSISILSPLSSRVAMSSVSAR